MVRKDSAMTDPLQVITGLDAVCDAATGDEWWPVSAVIRVREYTKPDGTKCSPVVCLVARDGTLAEDADANREFISTARTALPAALEALRRAIADGGYTESADSREARVLAHILEPLTNQAQR